MKSINAYASIEEAISQGALIPIIRLVEEDLARQVSLESLVLVSQGVASMLQPPAELKGSQELRYRLLDILWMGSTELKWFQSRAVEAGEVVSGPVAFESSFRKGIEGSTDSYELWITFEQDHHIILFPSEY